MLVGDVFSARLFVEYGEFTPGQGYLNPVYEDITSGILNVDIRYGTDNYEGPWQQIDTGQFTIVSRNPNLDPKVNPNIKYNSVIDFLDSRIENEVFFRGYVTDINVEYQRDDFPIITINGTDAYGKMQRAVVTQDLVDQIYGIIGPSGGNGPYDNGLSLFQLIFGGFYEWNFNIEDVSFNYIVNDTPGGIGNATGTDDDFTVYAPAKYWPAVGETYLELFNKFAQTNLNYTSLEYPINDPNITIVNVYPFAKYNHFYWKIVQDPALEFQTIDFSSDPADGRPYKSILLNNGYNEVMNAISTSNEYKTLSNTYEITSTNETFGIYSSNESKAEFGTTRANLNTIMPSVLANDTEMERYATDIFQVVAFPSDEIKQILFDNARYEDVQNDFSYSSAKLNQFVRIKHQVNNTETINRFYDICGIQHSISADKWDMSFTFKPSQQEIAYTYQNEYGEPPAIQMNSLTGDTNFNFTATIVNYDPADIEKVVWCLNGSSDDIANNWFYSQAEPIGYGEPNRYVDGLEKNGLTQTWNFDDDGILKGPNFPTGGYGSGEWYVIAYVFLKNGWVVAPKVKLTVGTPEVEAGFLWIQNQTNNFGQVTFADDSHNNETDEPDSYLWDFGDGNTSTLKNPVHVYDPDPLETQYDVSLTVFAYGPGGTKVYNTKTETITLVQPTLTADFGFVVNEQTVTFSNISINVGLEEPDAYLWEFGDGTISTEKNPVKTFASIGGVETDYDVTLTVRDIWERTDSITKTVTVEGTDSTGNFNVRYVKLRIENYTAGQGWPYETTGPVIRAVSPVLTYLRGTTSTTGINLFNLKPVLNLVNNNPSNPFNVNANTFAWFAKGSGSNPIAACSQPLANQNPELYLTRNPFQLNGTQYGLSGMRKYQTRTPTYWELVLDLGSEVNNLKNVITELRDLLCLSSCCGGGYTNITENYYPRVWVDVANTLGSLDALPANTFGTPKRNGNWVTVGYFPIRPGTMLEQSGDWLTLNMTPIRPMPLNVPYFNYTFNEKVVNFTSIETADSYLWNFGDGTTSTQKDPVKTYANYGTYNVTLQVTNGGVITRTTTEPVIVEKRKLVDFPVRYAKLVQNTHTGLNAFDTPSLREFAAEYQNFPVYNGSTYIQGTMVNTTEQYDAAWHPLSGTATPFDPNTGSLTNRQLICKSGSPSSTVVRIESLEPDFKTGWTTVIDFGQTINNITNFRLGCYTSVDGGSGEIPAAQFNGGSYTVYVTNHTGSTIDPNAVTWTQVGTITPGTLTPFEAKRVKLTGIEFN